MSDLNLPVLDREPTGRPHDYQFLKIQGVKGVTELVFDPEFRNKFANTKYLAPRDQKDRGTCVGQSSSYIKDLLYLAITADYPTDTDRAEFTKNVTDVLGTVHDILYPTSTSAECIYQISRQIGKVTYPAGSEIRYAVRAMKEYGCCLESQWHTDKIGTHVWDSPRETSDGGLSETDVKAFASNHVIDGYAMCGNPDGSASWDQVRYSIFTKGVVLAAIPVYENYSQMAGGDGEFPDPSGEIAGYHALCFYGYDEDYLYLIHSWGDWCGMFGKISRRYFDHAIDLTVWMVALDSAEKKIAEEVHRKVSITCNVAAQIAVDGTIVGPAPQTIACENGKTYTVTATMDGYVSQTKTVSDGINDLSFVLEAVAQPQPEPDPKPVVKSWFQILIEWISKLFKR
jgi:hypothetical protein